MDEETTTVERVGDMSPEAFATSLATATAEALAKGLEAAGLGQVDRTNVSRASTPPEERPDYGMSLRARFGFERQLGHLPEAERSKKIDDALLIHAWRVALTTGDFERADNVALGTYSKEMQGFLTQRNAAYQEEYRQLSTGATGGALVPVPLETSIIEKRALADKITPRSTQHQSDNTSLRLPREDTVAIATGTAENAAISATVIDYDELLLDKKKATALVTSSRELVFDASAALSFQSNISRQVGRALGVYNNTENLKGDGTGVRFTDGILVNAGVGTVLGGAATAATANTYVYAMESTFWDNLVWLMDQDTIQIFAGLEDTAGTRLYPNLNVVQAAPITGDAAAAGAGGIEGIPVVIMANSDMLGIAVLANLDFFATLVEPGIRVETTIDGAGAFENDQQKWKYVQRQDGLMALAAAFIKSATAIT